MKLRLIFNILMALAVSLVSCSDKPKGVLGEGDMVELIADIETAEAYSQTQGPGRNDETREQLINYILFKHGITKEEFDSTMTWYGRNIDKYQGLFEKVDKTLAYRQQKATGSNEKVEGNDLWPYSRHLLIDDNSASDNITFSLPVNEWDKGSSINWKMRLRSSSGGDVLLGVDYANGSTAYITQSAMGNKKIDLTMQTDTGKVVKRIYGYFHINADMERPMWIDSISLNSQPYDSTQYFQISRLRNYNGPHRKRVMTNADSIDRTTATEVKEKTVPAKSPARPVPKLAPSGHKPIVKPANRPKLKPMTGPGSIQKIK